jgi:trypsin-like peptidase
MFRSLAECVQGARNAVYAIVRLRSNGDGTMNMSTIGTGFVAAPGRMLTVAQLFVPVPHDREAAAYTPDRVHADHDVYLLARERGDGTWSVRAHQFALDCDLFLNAASDIAVLHLPDAFYVRDEKADNDPSVFLRMLGELHNAGGRVAVLGYPLSHLRIEGKEPRFDEMKLWFDWGMLLRQYRVRDGRFICRFSFPVYNGAAGSPILDPRSTILRWSADPTGTIRASRSIARATRRAVASGALRTRPPRRRTTSSRVPTMAWRRPRPIGPSRGATSGSYDTVAPRSTTGSSPLGPPTRLASTPGSTASRSTVLTWSSGMGHTSPTTSPTRRRESLATSSART